MQRGDMPLAHRFLPRRLRRDRHDGQVVFDQSFVRVVHDFLAAKERKERREQHGKERLADRCGLLRIREYILFYLELVRAKVDEQTVFDPGGFEVTEDLSGVFIGQGAAGFQLDDEVVVHQ